MNKKLLATSLIVLMLSLSVSTASADAQGIPNSDHIYVTTIGMPETVDPHWAYDTASAELIQNVYEPLCIFDTDKSDSFLPAIADWWPGVGVASGNAIIPIKPGWNGSSETWLFKIRTNVPWQDSSYGYVTAADVEYSFERGMLMDRTGGPIWMFYDPLLAKTSSYDYDVDGDGTLNEAEYLTLDAAVDNAIQSNGTHVWFNLAQPYAPFQQILSQTWSEVMCKQWCIAHDSWNGQHGNYTEFLRTWDPVEPGPLMEQPDAPGPVTPGPVAMGTGPYKLAAMSPDPHTGWYTLEKFDNYWRGWPAPGYMFTDGVAAQGFAKYVTVKCVEEWTTRKAQFFSNDPALQADFCPVPRPNIPELHEDGDKDGPTIPGFRQIKIAQPILYALYFTFEVQPTSDSVPKIGTTGKPDLFKDRYLRMAFMYSFNFTKFIEDVYLGEAEQSPVCMPPGTAYYNGSKPKYDIDVAKATEYFEKAWDGEIWSEGMTVAITYNTGNVMRQVTAEMLEYNIENLIPWPAGVTVDIQPTAVPWSVFLPAMNNQMYPTFIVGWLADFPDPHNWFVPFMHPTVGTYTARQVVTYGLDTASLNAAWYEGATYGPAPYTNALGETVSNINNTYIAHLIDTAVGKPPETRHLLYEELMDIYYAEATQLPMCYAVVRHYERTWIQGFDKTFNIHPLSPGYSFYTIWKGWYTPAPPPALASVRVLQGGSVPISTSFINPETKEPAAGLLSFVQLSLDNATWINVGAVITDENGYVNASVIPPLGTAYYRIQSTGYYAPAQASADLNVKYYEQLIESKALSPVMSPQIGTSVKVTTRTVEDVLTEALTTVATKSDVSSLSTEIASLKSAVSSLTTYLYVSIGIALVAIIAAVAALTRKKGPSAE